MNLASVMQSLGGKRTILIDADMRRPRVDTLGLEPGNGLSTYLIGEASVDELIRPTDVPGLDVLTAGPIPNPLELVEAADVPELFDSLKGTLRPAGRRRFPMGLVSST